MDHQIPQQSEVDAQKALLDALLGNDFQTFCNLLERGQVNPLYRYGFPHFSTCLEIASRHPEIPATFTSKLLECGVKPNVNVVVPEPIHYAARCGNAAVLGVLLSHAATRVNAVDSSGQSALHYIVLAFRDDCLPEAASEFESCIEKLIECQRFDINILDNTGLSAIHLAANKKRYRAATAIIEKSRAAHRDLDVDRHLTRGRTAREALQAELPDVCLRLITHGKNFPASKKRLLEAVDLGDFSLYQRLLRREAAKDGFDADFWFEKPYNTRLLERACGLRDSKLAAEFVRVTLDAGAHPSSVNLCSRRTPMHVAAAAGNWAALKLLVEHPLAEINVRDGNGQTPLHIAAFCLTSEHTHDCLELLLNVGNIDVNAKDDFGRTPADVAGCDAAVVMIEEKGGIKSGMSPPVRLSSRRGPTHLIKPAIQFMRNAGDGVAPLDSTILFDGEGEDIWPKPIPEKKILFDFMIQRRYAEFEELFEKMSVEENFLKCDECGYTFLQYACERGLHDFAKKLLEKVDPNETHEKNMRTPLMLACLQNDSHMVHILLNTKVIKVVDTNISDHKQNTALHYAAKNENMDIIFELLGHGADILAKNMFGKYPLSVEEMERLLDKSIEVRDNMLPSNDDFVLIFNYKMLISQQNQKNCLKGCNSSLIQSSPSKAESKNGKSVLLGPRSQVKYSEMNFLHSLSSSCEYAPLLKHPLITSFLRIKDDCMRPFLSLNLILCVVFVITLNVYIIIEVGKLNENSTMVHSIQMCFCAAAFICTMLMLLRETAQLVLKTNLYTKNCENLFDLCLILTAALILLHCPLGAFTQWAFTIAILLSWRDLFIVTGRHYKFSTNVQMLKAVSLNYLQILKSYIFIIFAFCLSFYVIFSQSTNQPTTNSQGNNTADIFNQTQTGGGGTEAINFFENPLKTLLKTVIMMTGEFEASNLPFLTDIWLTSVVFLLFLFFLHVVLLNLLTALAVSDEQHIRGNAEILSLMSQIQLLYEIENIALSLYTLFKNCKCISKHFQNLLLFSGKSLEEACLFTWPNKGTQARISGEHGDIVKRFNSKIVNEAKSIVTNHRIFSLENGGDTDGLSALIQHIEQIQTNVKLLLEEQHVKSGKNMDQRSNI
ncbi:transient receptor potential channel pyrexia-like isoform X1 [Schistocerca americana]|uniref:transient receptor potential channel pyrexia-like isoform X1 n=1 Tax=Schistocerca americana TaxID=7009 RepID=UPI001F502370|nr:transient receptor potential channel pyrexia-like isoform X1 [Schistocerca americana]